MTTRFRRSRSGIRPAEAPDREAAWDARVQALRTRIPDRSASVSTASASDWDRKAAALRRPKG